MAKKEAMRDLVATIETRIPLCHRDWRDESNKVDFLRNALPTEDLARQNLYSIGKGTHFRELQTELASPFRYTMKYCSEVQTVSNPSLNLFRIEAYTILHSTEVV